MCAEHLQEQLSVLRAEHHRGVVDDYGAVFDQVDTEMRNATSIEQMIIDAAKDIREVMTRLQGKRAQLGQSFSRIRRWLIGRGNQLAELRTGQDEDQWRDNMFIETAPLMGMRNRTPTGTLKYGWVLRLTCPIPSGLPRWGFDPATTPLYHGDYSGSPVYVYDMVEDEMNGQQARKEQFVIDTLHDEITCWSLGEKRQAFFAVIQEGMFDPSTSLTYEDEETGEIVWRDPLKLSLEQQEQFRLARETSAELSRQQFAPDMEAGRFLLSLLRYAEHELK